MSMPNFLIIGAPKAGTTALNSYLREHPQIYMSPVKEPGFFDFEGQKPNFSGPGDRELYDHVATDIKSYLELFQGVSDEIAIGEATTWYLYSPRAPERIQHYLPNIKLIVILRNPVDRAHSAFLHTLRDGREVITDFAQALKEEEKRIAKNWEYLWHYKQMGFYYVQLKRYFDRFDRSQIKVYLYEDLNNNLSALLKDIFQFIDIDETLIPNVIPRANVSGIPRSKWVNEFLKTKNKSFIKEFFKLFIPSMLGKHIIGRLNQLNQPKLQVSSDVRSGLIDVYREDILKLQELIHRDLSNWLE